MKNVIRFIAIAGASASLVALARADEIQFTALPQVVQSSVINETRIASPTKVVRVIQNTGGTYAVTVMTDTGQQVVYVAPTGAIVQTPATTVQETTTVQRPVETTTTTTDTGEAVVTTQEIQQAGNRYELIEKKGNKTIYLDHLTGKKVKVEIH
jgi:hypothetical protein